MANSSLDDFCGSTFWNSTLTWDTEDPDLTPCFQKTVLIWIPCAFLWLFSGLEVYYITNSKKRDIPWNFLNISKIILTGALIILSLTDVITSVNSDEPLYSVDIYTPIIKILTFSLSLLLLLYNKKKGLQSSGTLWIFWFLLLLCGVVQFRFEIRDFHNQDGPATYPFISYIIYYGIAIAIFLFNCFADHTPRISKHHEEKNPCPEQSGSFLSRLLFAWFDPLAWTGFRRPLQTSDLWTMNPEDRSGEVVPLYEKYWKKSLEKCGRRRDSQAASFKTDSQRVDFQQSEKKQKQASILPSLCKAFGPTFLFGALLKLFQDVLTFVNPQILKLLISFVEGKESLWKGYLYAFLMLVTAMIQTLVLSQYFHRMFLVGMRIRTALISTIYRKAMCMSSASRKESTVGEIVNLMSVDAQRFMELTAYLNMIWSAPLQIALSLYFLWDVLGPSVLAGLAVMIILIPVNGYIANKVKTLQIKQMKNKDERVKLMNEVLSGIKVLKLYAWEPSFESQILKIRNKEIKVLKQAAYMSAGTSFIWSCAPFLVSMLTFAVYLYVDETNVLTPMKAFVALTLFSVMRLPMSMLPLLIVYIVEVSLVSFATYVLISDENVLDAKKAFVSLSLFNILRFPLSMLPMMITNMVQTSVSIQRINKFMNSEELDPDNVTHDESEKDPIVIENGIFSWGEEPILKNIDLRIKKGTLEAIVGSVGAGKSSLLSALLGEMEKLNGRVNTVGQIAYVSQQAWIQNATLQDNILFGKPMDRKLYDKVIDACALKQDLDMLPGGDQTEIGEKGINLSGGQKQRVSLARAVYNNADIYLFDDPLSAVDSHVGKHIFEQVFGPNGLLKTKTRVLVTHGITYLPSCDTIKVLKNGEVSEEGTYKELLAKKGDFAEFLLQHLQENMGEEDEEQLDELKTQLTASFGSDEIIKNLDRHRSRVSESLSNDGSEQDKDRERVRESKEKSINGALNRQLSSDSGGSLRKRNTASPEKEERKPAQGEKLIEVEKTETGSVKWAVYSHYLKSIGIFLSISTIVLNMVFQGFSIGSNIWLSAWSNDASTVVNGTQDAAKRDMYLGVYGALGIGQALSVFASSLTLFVGCLNGAALLHDQVLRGVLRAPSPNFFDVTPVGRILNRFSKDIDTLDSVLPMTFRGWTSCLFAVGFFSIFCDLAPQLGCWFAARAMHLTMLNGVLRSPLVFFDVTPQGRILARFSKDIDVLDTGLPQQISDTVYCCFEVIATIFVISFSTPIFIAVIVPIGILYYFVQRFYVATSRQLKRLESVSRSPIYSHFGESVTGTSTIRAYGVQQRFINESEAKVDFNQICYYPSIIANRWLAVRLETVGNLIIFFAALFAVLGRDTMTSGLVGLSISYALQITQTLNWLVRMTSDVETNIVAVERIKEYSETEQEAPWELPNSTTPATWPEKGEVEFKEYAVRYRPGLDLVLKGVSFKVNGGEKIGIVGRTGAGKSSLTLSLFRIIEAADGAIFIDGVNIATLGLHALRSRLTIIPQDAVLFSGSLRLNLDPFDKHSDEEVWRALEHAHLKAFVKGLTAGLNHEVSEGGENLSVGQRQLICLGRALLRKTKVLILDEATAAVDLETDDLIQRTIKTEFNDCTVLTIAHRLNTIMDSDRVIVLDKGRIVEFETPGTLLQNKNSIFYGMAKDAGLV